MPMELSTTIPAYTTGDHLVDPDTIETYAQAAEEYGFAGLWSIDHLVKPPTYGTAMMAPLVSLTYAAAVTDTIPLGTSILILPLRRTANVIHRVNSLHHVSGERLTLGLGAGYSPKEFEVTGVPRNERGPRLTEGIEVMKRLFAGEASFDGRFHSFADARIDPVPEAPPRIIVGGDSKQLDDDVHLESDARQQDASGRRHIPQAVLDRIVANDGWIAPSSNPEKVREEWDIIQEHARVNDVDPDSLARIQYNYVYIVEDDDASVIEREQRAAFDSLLGPNRGYTHAQDQCLTGSIDDILAWIDAYDDIGFTDLILAPATSDPDELHSQLDLIQTHLLPHVHGT